MLKKVILMPQDQGKVLLKVNKIDVRNKRVLRNMVLVQEINGN